MQRPHRHEQINSVTFNEDSSLMSIASNIGFKIYSTCPFTIRQDRDFGAPLNICEVIGRSNLIGVVGMK